MSEATATTGATRTRASLTRRPGRSWLRPVVLLVLLVVLLVRPAGLFGHVVVRRV